MRTRQRGSTLGAFIILGILLPGLMSIFAVQAKAIEDQTLKAQAALQSGTATPTSTLTSTPLSLLTATGSPPSSLSFGATPGRVSLYAFVQAPTGPVARPYVNLIAFASLARKGSVQIRGFLNSDEFICSESPCVIYLKSSSRLVFRAYAESGESSDEIIASVAVVQELTGYVVTIDTVSQFTAFNDSCSRVWGEWDEVNAKWDNFVQFPYELNTRKTLHQLAAKLILNGIVDASSCATGGLSLGLDWPTGCGLQKATDAMIAWQNQFDEYIWLASRDQGIPPKIVKTLVEFESHYWPANSRFYIDEIGLGQINQLGIDVLLRRDATYYLKVCLGISDCSVPYTNLDPITQGKIRGAVLTSINAECPECQYGIDLDKAKQSIALVTSLVKANCQQVDAILNQPYTIEKTSVAETATAAVATVQAGGDPGTTYEDLWRFTLVSYHSGVSCFQQAVQATRENNQDMTWNYLRNNLSCKGARDYVDGLMDNLFTFENYRYEPSDALTTIVNPTIVPTRTPIPSPTVYISTAQIEVQVYMDRNGNNTPDPGEWIDAMTVQVMIDNSLKLTQRTQNGITTFDMTGYTPNAGIEVSLPGLYRSEVFRLPEQGKKIVIFKFDQPALPTILP